jgi:MarR family transcriptional regulator for hemolysin
MATVTRQMPDLSFLLNHASYVLRTRMDAAFAEIGLTPRGYCVLSKAMDGEYTQIELAKLSDLDKTTMVITLDELERLGYAERRPSPADRRARIVAVTPEGAKAAAEGVKVADTVHREVLDALTPDQRAVFTAALDALTGGLLAEPVECDRPVRRPRADR